MGFWSRSPPTLTQEYQEGIAHRVRDILTGADHSSHARSNKVAIKALQRPDALAGVIEILKTMPDPNHRADGWEVDEGVDMNSEEEDEEQGRQQQQQRQQRTQQIQALFKGKEKAKDGDANRSNLKLNGPTIVAATTIAAAAATSAAAATLAVTKGRKPQEEVVQEHDSTVVEITETSEIISKTVVRFHPSRDTVSSHAYWWGYEIFIPQDALARISSAQDVSSAFLGFLGSVGLIVPAIVPFLGYIAAYVGLEFAVIKAQNEGKGVILASTWLVPVALVPRAWDVPDEEGISAENGGV
ncbi:hypothetical protein EDD21DRAFT_388464 [Dissophora ornata]|nr:hypothetical protein BGZ58_001008 [Dissophora ornata]KAI8596369.1 hypothetical protein EDD21DRAFT_388464 [Dissophora ornata]